MISLATIVIACTTQLLFIVCPTEAIAYQPLSPSPTNITYYPTCSPVSPYTCKTPFAVVAAGSGTYNLQVKASVMIPRTNWAGRSLAVPLVRLTRPLLGRVFTQNPRVIGSICMCNLAVSSRCTREKAFCG